MIVHDSDLLFIFVGRDPNAEARGTKSTGRALLASDLLYRNPLVFPRLGWPFVSCHS